MYHIQNLLNYIHWEKINGFAESQFGSASISALIGAFAGAYGAYYIAERAKEREQLTKEIRNVNAGIMVAFHICNLFISLKKQHVKALKERYEATQANVQAGLQRLRAGVPQEPVQVLCDLQTLQPILIPVEVLQNIIFEKLSISGTSLLLVSQIAQSAATVNDSIAGRNEQLEKYKTLERQEVTRLYLGHPDQNGAIDRIYPDLVDAIYSQTDDVIHFGTLLCKDLNEYGESLLKRYKKRFRKYPGRISKPDWKKAEDKNLMPDPENYKDWENVIQKVEEKTFVTKAKEFFHWKKASSQAS